MARPVNHDKRINELLVQLRRALVAKEQARIEATVEAQMAGLVGGLGKAGTAMVASPTSTPVPATTPKKRKGWSPSAKAKARERMKKYWAARKAKGGARAKAAKAAPVETPKT